MSAKPSLSTHIQSAKAPWASLLVLKPGQRVESIVRPPDGFLLKVLNGRKCRTPTALFSEFSRSLKFPEYFGFNWDALEECLADLEWLPAKGYVLILTDAAEILREDEEGYATLLEVLNDAGETWASGQAGGRRGTPFHTVFAVSSEAKSSRSHWGLDELDCGTQLPRTKRTSQRKPSSR